MEDLKIALEVLLFRDAGEKIQKCNQNEMVLKIAKHFDIDLKQKITTKQRDKALSVYKKW
tara:strand:- start:1028 stop:1207 length:180 start_codon:yes stop_codon:yes gene_type:complete